MEVIESKKSRKNVKIVVSVVGFEVFTEATTMFTLFWDISLCNLVDGYKDLKITLYLHFQGRGIRGQRRKFSNKENKEKFGAAEGAPNNVITFKCSGQYFFDVTQSSFASFSKSTGCQTQVEAAREEKTGRTQSEIQKNVLANGSSFCPICT
jgi:hypothetical protein